MRVTAVLKQIRTQKINIVCQVSLNPLNTLYSILKRYIVVLCACCKLHMSNTCMEDDVVRSCAIPWRKGVQMSRTDFTCGPVCLSESVTYCQGSVLTQGRRCLHGHVLPCV